jgi:Fe-S oxidoreductase
MAVETDNAKEEAKEIVEKCFKCGLCRVRCPVLRVMREEEFSPRGKAIIISNNGFERIVYDCTLCKSCQVQCPADIHLCDAFIKARGILVRQKKELPENKEMLKNISKTGNIFGLKDPKKEEENKEE